MQANTVGNNVIFRFVLFVSLIALVAPTSGFGRMKDAPSPKPSIGRQEANPSLGQHHPSAFEQNRGQTDPRVSFLKRTPTSTAFFLPDGVRVAYKAEGNPTPTSLGLDFVNANPQTNIVGRGAQIGISNYLHGSDRSHWVTNVPTYAALEGRQLYRGVDIVWYERDSGVEFDLVVAPGADVTTIDLAAIGATAVELDHDGNVAMSAGSRSLTLRAPIAYQATGHGRQLVAASYVLNGPSHIGLKIGEFDRTLPLVIDPVLSYSSYIGGDEFDSVNDIAVDGMGNLYLVGETQSVNFPHSAGLSGDPGDSASDAVVTKISPNGDNLVFSTYLGGNSSDTATSIALDASGNIYVTGTTASSDFPTNNPIFPQLFGIQDSFVAKLNPTGITLIFSTYLGGGADDTCTAICVDSTNAVYVTGTTESDDFPTVNPLFGDPGDLDFDAFVTKINAAGSELVFSTYLGGDMADGATSIAVSSSGEIFAAGFTRSTDFPTTNPAFGDPGDGASDGWVARINSTEPLLVFSRYLGGSNSDQINALAIDSNLNVYVVGGTDSTDFPVVNPIQVDPADAASDGFITKLGPSGVTTVFSTYVGGSGSDTATDIALGPDNEVFVAGNTSSTNLPITGAIQITNAGGLSDGFVIKLNPFGTVRLFGTYLGGSDEDQIHAIAVDQSQNAYVGGRTLSTDFPTAEPFQGDTPLDDGFVAKIGDATADLSVDIVGLPDPVRSGQQLTYTVTVSNAGPNAAGNVVATTMVPAATSFVSANATTGSLDTPTVGLAGPVSLEIGILASGQTVTLTLVVQVNAPTGSTVLNTATVSSTAFDPNTANNTAPDGAGVIDPITPPSITLVESLVVTGKPYRVKITGANFAVGAQVFIGADTTPWPTVKYKNSATLIVKKGDALKAKFPKRVPVTVRVVNPDGGEASFDFTR